MKVIGLTGFAQSGKDTAAGFLAEFGFKRLAFADILRQSLYNLNPILTVSAMRAEPLDDPEADLPGLADFYDMKFERVQDLVDRLGWDVAKVAYPEIRALLQRLGTEVGRDLYGESFWVDRVIRQIKASQNSAEPIHYYVITDVRFPNEYEAVKNLGGEIWRIQRPGVGAVNNHVSEQVLPHDLIVPNTGDLEAFRRSVLDAAGLPVD